MENRIKLRSMTVGHPVVSFEDRKLLPQVVIGNGKVQLEMGPGGTCGPEDRGQDLQRVLV